MTIAGLAVEQSRGVSNRPIASRLVLTIPRRPRMTIQPKARTMLLVNSGVIRQNIDPRRAHVDGTWKTVK